MESLRKWWDSLDNIWHRILILNLGLEHKMGGVKNYINDIQWDYKKIESLYEEGVLDKYKIIQKEFSDDFIKNIVNLKVLIADNTSITDLTPLSKLENLEILNCAHNKIINIDPLKDLLNLQELNLAFNQITSVSSLQNLKKLRKLELLYNNILSLEPIKDLENLEELSCLFNFDSNSKLILKLNRKWKKLKRLSAHNISDLQNLSEFYPDLESLYVGGLDGALSNIIKLKRLRVLYIIGNQIIKLDPLAELTDLKILYCGFNYKIESIEPLSYLPNLERLGCDNNQIIDLNPLRKLKKLRVLDCGKNIIESLKPLEDLTNLQYLDCSNSKSLTWGNKITSLDSLKNLSNLKRLNCKDNPIPPEEIEMLKATIPNCEINF